MEHENINLSDRQVIDVTGPTDWDRTRESKALRRKIRAWAQTKGVYRAATPADYARALNITISQAEKRVEQQLDHLASRPPVIQKGELVDATGPTDWARRPELKALRRRILNGIHRRCYVS